MSNAVPSGWTTYQLDEICDVIGGGTPDRSNSAYWNGDIPWVSPTEITSLNGRYISNSREKITVFGLSKSSAKLHPAGTVLMTSRASIGLAAINTIPVATNQGFQSFRCTGKIYNEFLYQLIMWMRRELERLAAGSTFLEISSTNVKSMSVVIPEHQEQQKIAAILTAVDDVIESTQAQISKLKDLKTGMMQELLTKGIGHTEFKDSPVGRIPAGWEVLMAEDVALEIVVGIVVQPTQYYVESGIPALRSANVRETGLNSDNLKYISHESNEKLKKSKLQEGDLVTVRTGYPGTTAVVEKQFEGSNCIDVIITRPRNIVDSNYLCTWINSDSGKGQVLKAQGGLAQQHFNVGDMKRMLVALPPLNEQRKISEILKTVTLKLELVNMRLGKLQDHKKALMQDLLTGTVRIQAV